MNFKIYGMVYQLKVRELSSASAGLLYSSANSWENLADDKARRRQFSDLKLIDHAYGILPLLKNY